MPWVVIWDNGHSSGQLSEEHDSEEHAQEAAEDWKAEMVSVDPNPKEAEEAYSWDVVFSCTRCGSTDSEPGEYSCGGCHEPFCQRCGAHGGAHAGEHVCPPAGEPRTTIRMCFSAGLEPEKIEAAIEAIREAVEAAGGTMTVETETEGDDDE